MEQTRVANMMQDNDNNMENCTNCDFKNGMLPVGGCAPMVFPYVPMQNCPISATATRRLCSRVLFSLALTFPLRKPVRPGEYPTQRLICSWQWTFPWTIWAYISRPTVMISRRWSSIGAISAPPVKRGKSLKKQTDRSARRILPKAATSGSMTRGRGMKEEIADVCL